MDSVEVTQALYRVRRYALGSILANDYARDDDPHADASADYADEELALRAQDLVCAINALSGDKRPIHWGGKFEVLPFEAPPAGRAVDA